MFFSREIKFSKIMFGHVPGLQRYRHGYLRAARAACHHGHHGLPGDRCRSRTLVSLRLFGSIGIPFGATFAACRAAKPAFTWRFRNQSVTSSPGRNDNDKDRNP